MIGLVKKTPKMFFHYNGEDMSLISIYNKNKTVSWRTFLYFSDGMSDITWIQAFQMLLQMFRTLLTENVELPDEKIDELVDAFINAIPALLRSKLKAAKPLNFNN